MTNTGKDHYDTLLQEVQNEIAITQSQSKKRQDLISKVEKERGTKLLFYVTKLQYSLDYDDINLFGSMLSAMGETDNVELVIQSPGGNGLVAEKVTEMIRQYCRKTFRVIVPNLAKSAATMVALAADQIIMGVTSELGPIDPQIFIKQTGATQVVSAQSFLDAKSDLENKLQDAERKGEPTLHLVTQLSLIDPAFINYCQKNIDFALDFATKNLSRYMFKKKTDGSQLASTVAANLCGTGKYFLHGRTISAQTIKSSSELSPLNVVALDKEDPQWKALYELYLRAEVFLDMADAPNIRRGKLFESSNFSMYRNYPV